MGSPPLVFQEVDAGTPSGPALLFHGRQQKDNEASEGILFWVPEKWALVPAPQFPISGVLLPMRMGLSGPCVMEGLTPWCWSYLGVSPTFIRS